MAQARAGVVAGSSRDLASPHHVTVASVFATKLPTQIGGHRFRGGDDSGTFSVGLAVNTREAEKTLIKSTFENLVVQHQFAQAFDLVPSGAGVGILDDEMSFVFQLLPRESHKLNEDPKFIAKSSNISLGIETHEGAPVATRKNENQAEGFLGPDLAPGSIAISRHGEVEAGGEGEGTRRGWLPTCGFSTDRLRVGVDLLEEGALARDGLIIATRSSPPELDVALDT